MDFELNMDQGTLDRLELEQKMDSGFASFFLHKGFNRDGEHKQIYVSTSVYMHTQT